jgi:hypothetical protein
MSSRLKGILLTSKSFVKRQCQGKTSYSREMLRTSTLSAERRLDAANGQDGHKLFSLHACGLTERCIRLPTAHEFHRLVSNPRLVVGPSPVSTFSDTNLTDETSGRGATRSLLEQTHDGAMRKRRYTFITKAEPGRLKTLFFERIML